MTAKSIKINLIFQELSEEIYMKEKANLFENFLGDEFTINYIENSNKQTRMHLTAISSWCKILADAEDSECDYDFRTNVANNIMKLCCQMLKNYELCMKIIDSGKEDNLKMITIELNEFLTAFCRKCNKHIKHKCRIILEDCSNAYIEANEKFLNFIFLMYVRMALEKKSEKMEMSFSSEENYVTICLKIDEGKSNDNMYCEVVPDTCDDYIGDIASLLLKKMDATISENGNCTYIKFCESKGGTFCSSKSDFPGEDLFSIFNSMLADFDDYKYY